MSIIFEEPVETPVAVASETYHEITFMSDPNEEGVMTKRVFRVPPQKIPEIKVHTQILTEEEVLARLESDDDIQLVSCVCCNANEERHGLYEEYYPDGQIMRRSMFEHGQLHGDIMEYYPNGQIMRTGTFEHGKRHGEFIRYYNDGGLMQVSNFQNGEPHGILLRYDHNGNRVQKNMFDQGRLTSTFGVGRRVAEDLYAEPVHSSKWHLSDQAGGGVYVRKENVTGTSFVTQTGPSLDGVGFPVL
jgi:hypothetical protein